MANLSHFLMLAAGCASAVAWDLHQLEGRILDLDEPATKEMEKRHLLRAFMVFGISFLVIAADSLLRIRVRFIILIVLTVLMILVLNQVMLLVRNIGKPRAPKETVYRSTIGQNIFSDPESWSFTERDRQLASSEKPPDKQ